MTIFDTLPDITDIDHAAAQLAGLTRLTPLLESCQLNQALGLRLLFKADCLQHTGSFKFRGACHRIMQIPAAARGNGVVAFSSGNHAQGVAAAAQRFGLPATVIMPADAPALKVAATRDWGARVVFYDRVRESREAIAGQIAAETGATLVKPFDDAGVIAGQGTIGLELARQAADLDARLDHVLVPCSGGGLAAGVALALGRESPQTIVHTAEPAGFDDYARSLAAGRIERNPALAGSICDALMAPQPGTLTFAVNQPRLGQGYAADDATVLRAMGLAFLHLKLVVEPGGAAAFACVLAHAAAFAGQTVAVILSGGNADPACFARALATLDPA